MLPFMSHWLELRHVTTPAWEMESFSWVAGREEILGDILQGLYEKWIIQILGLLNVNVL